MKKFNKRDILNILILTISFIVFVLILSNNKYLYGSKIDWYAQHIAFPDYFRNLFYNTKNLFPDFAFNIGSGQNIYNFSYYGLLSPIILISYLLPFINMTTYMILSTIITCIISSIVLYYWLKKKGYSENICLTSSMLFLFATPITFHSHRHIMFINYMPFLIMGLFGVDKKLEKNKSWLLSLSVFLMCMTSYYYSIGGIITLVIYGVYKYLSMNNKITFIKFIKDGINFVAPIFIGILSSCIILLPTFQVILSGRGETYNTITLKDLILPGVYTETIMYAPYGIGLTAIILLSIINLFNNKKENIFLGTVLSLTLIFPIVSYILNATMYIDAKALIPMLPICIYAITIFIDKVFKNEINYKKIVITMLIVTIFVFINKYKFKIYCLDLLILSLSIILYKKTNKQLLLVIPVCIFAFTVSIFISKSDVLVEKNTAKNDEQNIKEVINYIRKNDSSYYRIDNTLGSDTDNKIYNINNLSSTLYSSIYNMEYNKFYYDVMNNNIQSRNRVITSENNNVIFNMLTSNKYLISKSDKVKHGYEYVDKIGKIYIYKNENALPIAYANSSIISYDDFEKIGYPYTDEILLNNIVVDKSEEINYISNIKKIEYDINSVKVNDGLVEKNDNIYIIHSTGKASMEYELPEEYKNKIIFVRFDMKESQSCKVGDLSIKINGNKNKLTCAEWKYHNKNYKFDYVIADKDLSKLFISFNKGTFKISNIELYALDYAYIENIRDNIDELKITYMKDNKLEGNIEVRKDGYFVTNIPYDSGFNAYIDGEKINIEKVNSSFLGFKIKEGKHDIKIIYKSPSKNIGMIISIVGIMIYILVCYVESKQKL